MKIACTYVGMCINIQAIYISKIAKDSVAAVDGKLRGGDTLLQVRHNTYNNEIYIRICLIEGCSYIIRNSLIIFRLIMRV